MGINTNIDIKAREFKTAAEIMENARRVKERLHAKPAALDQQLTALKSRVRELEAKLLEAQTQAKEMSVLASNSSVEDFLTEKRNTGSAKQITAARLRAFSLCEQRGYNFLELIASRAYGEKKPLYEVIFDVALDFPHLGCVSLGKVFYRDSATTLYALRQESVKRGVDIPHDSGKGNAVTSRVMEDIQAGMSIAEVAEKHNCSRSFAKGIRLNVFKLTKTRNTLSPADREAITQRLLAGVKESAITTEFAVSDIQVRNIRKDLGKRGLMKKVNHRWIVVKPS